MADKLKETDRFEAFDSEGKAYTIIEHIELPSSPPSGDPGRAIKGPKRFKTPDGKKVTRIDGLNFEIHDYKPIRVRRAPGP
jgi:hypothetical protein